MTNEEVVRDIRRFKEYLAANGVRTLAVSVFFDATGVIQCFAEGSAETLEERSIGLIADLAGFKLIEKP